MESIESRLNFSENKGNSTAIILEAGRSEEYYQNAFIGYCNQNDIDYSDDNCAAMIMSNYTPYTDHFWFWID